RRATRITRSRSLPIGTNKKESSAIARRRSPGAPNWRRNDKRWRIVRFTPLFWPQSARYAFPERPPYPKRHSPKHSGAGSFDDALHSNPIFDRLTGVSGYGNSVTRGEYVQILASHRHSCAGELLRFRANRRRHHG